MRGKGEGARRASRGRAAFPLQWWKIEVSTGAKQPALRKGAKDGSAEDAVSEGQRAYGRAEDAVSEGQRASAEDRPPEGREHGGIRRT